MDRAARSQADIKMNNTGLVLGLIRHQGPLSRADLARRTGLSATSMTRIVTALIIICLVLIIGGQITETIDHLH